MSQFLIARLLFSSGWRCGGVWEISAFLIATEELQRWDGAVLGRDTVLCTALFQSWIHQDTGKYFLEKRVIKRKSLGMFYQECCLGRGSA